MTCGCACRKEELINTETSEIIERTIVVWGYRCPAHINMRDIEAYERILWEGRVISDIEEEIKMKAPPKAKTIHQMEDSDDLIVLNEQISIEFGEVIRVTLPESLKSLIPDLEERPGVEYL